MLRRIRLRNFALCERTNSCVKSRTFVNESTQALFNRLHVQDPFDEGDVNFTFGGHLELLPEVEGIYETTGIIQDITNGLITVHESGIPWWLTFFLASLCSRMLCLPMSLAQRQNHLKMKALEPAIDEANAIVEAAPDQETKKTLTEELEIKRKELYKKYGVKKWKNFIVLMNIAAILPSAFAVRMMVFTTGDQYGLSTGGFGWFVDLLSMDPYYILPITFGVLNLVRCWLKYFYSPRTIPDKFNGVISVGISTFIAYFLSARASALSLLLVTSSVNGIIIEYLLGRNTVRKFLVVPEVKVEDSEGLLEVIRTKKQQLLDEMNPLYKALIKEKEAKDREFEARMEAETAARLSDDLRKLEELKKKPYFWQIGAEEDVMPYQSKETTIQDYAQPHTVSRRKTKKKRK